MEHYFAFHRLQEYYDILAAIVISSGVILIAYTLAALYYWTTRDLLKK